MAAMLLTMAWRGTLPMPLPISSINVLRKRAQMKLKVKALSSEAKASAYILGCLPFVIFGMIFMVNPDYISGFFTNPVLIATGLGAMVWMSIGVAIMAKMINFEI